ncbi:beta-lactamase-like protein [Mariannaea sp. PMI_226]|nr:beta-lactamase-like protein [Mariannaea sp. PMI_226]
MGFTAETYDPATAATWLVCVTCGTQFPTADRAKVTTCFVCDDPRQYVPPSGQSFITLGDMKKTHKNDFSSCPTDSRITFISSTPKFAIGQRAMLVETPAGNVLWDCITLLDEETIAKIEARGGLKAIVISHPHFYSTHVQWARAFKCPVYLASDDKSFTAMESGHQVFVTETETEIEGTGLKAIKLGGHFPGSMVLQFDRHLLIADTLMTTMSGVSNWEVDALGQPRSQGQRPPGLNTFAFLYSIPNYIPLSVDEMTRMWGILRQYDFSETHGGFTGMDIVDRNLKQRVLDSMKIQARHMGYGESEFMKTEL